MENSPTIVLVVAAAVQGQGGRLLLQQCPPHKRHAGLWEFPGGKVESGEIPRSALRREVLEELGIRLDPSAMKPAGFADETSESGGTELVLFLYNCPVWNGEPEGREGQQWGWFTHAEADLLPLPPMDRLLLQGLSRELR